MSDARVWHVYWAREEWAQRNHLIHPVGVRTASGGWRWYFGRTRGEAQRKADRSGRR
jgi:hypothetical protein